MNHKHIVVRLIVIGLISITALGVAIMALRAHSHNQHIAWLSPNTLNERLSSTFGAGGVLRQLAVVLSPARNSLGRNSTPVAILGPDTTEVSDLTLRPAGCLSLTLASMRSARLSQRRVPVLAALS